MRHAVLVLLALIYGNYKNSSVKVIRICKENILSYKKNILIGYDRLNFL